MKQLFRTIVSGAFLLIAMPLTFTSCEGALDDIFGEWSRPGSEDPYVLSAALKEGALVSYTIIENGVEKVITFKKVGNEYVLITPASTRSLDRGEERMKTFLHLKHPEKTGHVDDFNNTNDPPSLVLTVNADDETPALKAVTQIADASTQVAKYKEGYELRKITWKGGGGELVLPPVMNKAILKYEEDPNNPPLNIELGIPDLGKSNWGDLKNMVNLSTNKYSQIYITTKYKTESIEEEIEDVKFKVYYKDNSGNEVRSMYLDIVEARTYILKLDDETE